MNAVGIDVSKGKSMVAIMRPFGEIVSTPFEIKHTISDISSLVELINSIEGESTTIYLWLISLTASKELSILLLKLYNDGAIGISSLFLDIASAIKTDNQLLIRSVRFMQVESP